MELPGWNSIETTGTLSGFFFWASIFALVLLGIAEVMSHRYGERHDLLMAQKQRAEKDASDGEIARLHKDTAEANARALEAQLALTQYRAPRQFSAQQIARLEQVAAQHKGLIVHFWLAGEGHDVEPLATTMAEAFKRGGNWTAKTWSWSGVNRMEKITVTIKHGASPLAHEMAGQIMKALDGAAAPQPPEWPGDWAQFPGMLNGPPFTADESEIRIIVGLKPE